MRRDRDDDVLLRRSDEALLAHGDTARGANWPNETDRRKRFDVMLDVVIRPPSEPVDFCDFGCGTGELLAHIRRRRLTNIRYLGVDRSKLALEYARAKFPEARFLERDIHNADCDLGALACDYLCINGLFTTKWEMSSAAAWTFLQRSVNRLWPHVRKGIALNVMSKAVDWERDDLLHVSMDDMARLLHALAGRRVLIRADYGLYEYTAYAFREDPEIDLVGAQSARKASNASGSIS